MNQRRIVYGAVLSLATVVITAVLFACSQTPTSVPIRTFERAERVDVICLNVADPSGPVPQPQAACAPVPPDVDGRDLDNQLFALVTQTSRGEVAVVDLSAGFLIDQSRGVPGVNFLPVGAVPTDVAATPDGRMAFVASAEPNKFAIYGIPGHRILGDAAGRRDPEGATTLASWPACALPQRPGALTVMPRQATPLVPGMPTLDAGGAADGGATDGGTEAGASDAGSGAPASADDLPYELIAILPGDRANPAKVITIDPRPFLRSSPRRDPTGKPIDDFGEGPALTPGTLVECPIMSVVPLAGAEALPPALTAGQVWEDGVKYVEAGVDLTCDVPERASRCGGRPCRCPSTITNADGGAVDDGGTCTPDDAGGTIPDGPLDLGPLDPPKPIAVARDDRTLYVADDAVPFIHVIDLSNPADPHELEPFVVTSIAEPSRAISVRDIAISPPTREYKRFLYAVDRKQGSIAVFDVSDPKNADRRPMLRPHPELNPFQPPDRIAFSAPVVAVAFVRHDFPLDRIRGVPVRDAKTGLLCNPNANLDPTTNPADLGVFYRANSNDPIIPLGPTRLRGIFAFATLSNGSIVGIDVDDWDAPCRRPLDLSTTNGTVGSLAVPQPQPASPTDYDPYHAPVAPPDSVTQEVFFPVTMPHRIRSAFLLRDEARSGRHIPFIPSTPTIQTIGPQAPLFGEGSEATPRLRPTSAPGITPSAEELGVRFSLEVPDVHFDQDWAVTYEGVVPGFDGLPATLSSTDGYQSIILSQPQARFCAKGVEDWSVSAERASSIQRALAASGRPPFSAPSLERRMVDYVQIVDELLPPTDPYWTQEDLPEPNSCWDPQLTPGRARYNSCLEAFGTMTALTPSPNRDFPIIEAYDDHLVISRFATLNEQPREVVYSDPSNTGYLKLMRCCFHHQVRFNVRAASQWVAVGAAYGFMSHLTTDANNRCVPSCDGREQLLNARAPALPYTTDPVPPPLRDSPLAMRNPAFSFFVQNGHRTNVDAPPRRDMSWRFQTRGQFTPLVINLAASTSAVNPQSMRFIETLGQIAVVDGASQGLVLIDLAGVTIARAPYF